MITVYINGPATKKILTINSIICNAKSKVELIGDSGERLKTFLLAKGDNELSLDEFKTGIYTLRLEAGNEVIVKQIIIQ